MIEQISKKFFLDKRVWPGALFLFIPIAAGIYWDIPWMAPFFLLLLGAHLLFFRDPCREPARDGVLAPADGKVTGIDEVFESRFLHEPAVRIRIFLSIFDVHVTRAPLSGIVKHQNYVKGKFLNALRKIAFEYNESNWIGIENHERRVLVRQMTGAIARRIYSDVRLQQVVGRGEKIGMMCYASGVEVFVAK